MSQISASEEVWEVLSFASGDEKKEIKKLYEEGIYQKDIAKMFNVSQAKISGVVNDITN